MPLPFPFSGRNNHYDKSQGKKETFTVVKETDLEDAKQRRYRDNWSIYRGDNISALAIRRTGAGAQGHTGTKVNYNKKLINTMNSFAFGSPWSATLDYKPYSERQSPRTLDRTEIPEEVTERRHKLSEMLRFADDTFHRKNPGHSLRLKNSLYASVTGDCYFVVVPIVDDSIERRHLLAEDAEDAELIATNENKIRVLAVNPAFCTPTHGPDGETLTKLIMEYPVEVPGRGQGWLKQTITPSKIVEELTVENTVTQTATYSNEIGRVYAVHIKNYPVPTRYGLSDVEDISGAVDELNDKVSNVSDIVDYHASPTTIIYGARMSTLEKGANKLWSGLPHTAKVENLELKGDLSPINDYINLLRDMIKENTGVNEAALGGDLAISNSSGIALHTRFYSMTNVATLKWNSWDYGVKQTLGLTLLWGRSMGLISFTDEEYTEFQDSLQVTFSPNLPKDILLKIQRERELVEGKLKPRTKSMSDLGSSDPVEDLHLIISEESLMNNTRRGNASEGSPSDFEDPENPSGPTGRNISGFRSPDEAS